MKPLTMLMMLVGCGMCLATEPYVAYSMRHPPVVDGQFQEADWQYLPEKRGFFIFRKKDYAFERETAFRIGIHGDKLYLGVRCQEPTPERIVAHDHTRDGLWADDCIEFFFLPVASDNYMQVVINAKGVIWAKREKDLNTVRAEDIGRAAVRIAEDRWNLEAELNLGVLDPADKGKGSYRFLLGRTTKTAPAEEQLTSWPGVWRGYGDKERFAPLTLSPLNGLVNEHLTLNAEYDGYLYGRLAAISRGVPTSVELGRFGHTEDFRKLQALRAEIASRLGSIRQDREAQKRYFRRWVAQQRLAQIISRPLSVELSSKDCQATLHVQGVPLGADGQVVVHEGITALVIRVKATGVRPRVRVRLPGHPSLLGSWRLESGWNSAYLKPEFNDSSWKMVSEEAGWLVLPAGESTLRHLLIWNETPFGNMAVISPRVKVWGFSEGGFDSMLFHVYSPFGHVWNDYEQWLDLPQGFEVLNPVKSPTWGNWSPKAMRREAITRDGLPYVRHVFSYRMQGNPPGCGFYNFIPIRHVSFGKPGQTFKMYFSRRANGNVSELETSLPGMILPPVRGGKLKKLKVQFYTSQPYLHGAGRTATPEETRAVLESGVKAGGNQFIVKMGDEYSRKYAALAHELGASVIMWVDNYPVWGTTYHGELEKLLARPGYEARGFQDRTWDLGRATHGKVKMYCPSKVLGEGREAFKDAVRKDFQRILKSNYPCEGLFMNWEQFVWLPKGHRGGLLKGDGDGSYCFCPDCKRAFGLEKGIAGAEKLSDEEIYRQYKDEFEDFRNRQSARIHGIVRDIITEDLGLEDVFYCQTAHKGYWKHAAGTLDQLFVGCPGNPSANAKWQRFIDDSQRFFAETVGKRRFIGQRFTYFSGGYRRPRSWQSGAVLSDSGYLEPQSWKSQLVRMFASVHGGVDLASPYTLVAGIQYYVGEATRLASTYEDLFYDGVRQDRLAESADLSYPNLLVLTLGAERLVLAFNEGAEPKRVTIRNRHLRPGQRAHIYGEDRVIAQPATLTVSVPAGDVVAIHID